MGWRFSGSAGSAVQRFGGLSVVWRWSRSAASCVAFQFASAIAPCMFVICLLLPLVLPLCCLVLRVRVLTCCVPLSVPPYVAPRVHCFCLVFCVCQFVVVCGWPLLGHWLTLWLGVLRALWPLLGPCVGPSLCLCFVCLRCGCLCGKPFCLLLLTHVLVCVTVPVFVVVALCSPLQCCFTAQDVRTICPSCVRGRHRFGFAHQLVEAQEIMTVGSRGPAFARFQ